MKIETDKKTGDELEKMVNSFAGLKGWNFWKELLKWVFTGMFMGASDGIPGYSGGTTLALLGFFKRLVLIAKSVFFPEKGITRIKALVFLLPFGAGWICGIFGFAHLTEYLTHHHMGLELMFFFSAFIAFSIPLFLRGEKPLIGKAHKGYRKRRIYSVLGFAGILTIGIVITTTTDGAPFHGKNKDDNFSISTGWWKLILVAFFGGAFTLIPGGSGALLQLLTGMYATIHWTIMGNAGHQFGSLVLFAISSFLGMLAMVLIFSWLLKHKQNELAAVSLGMLIASIIVVIIIPEHAVWHNLRHWYHVVGIFVGYGLGITLSYVIHFFVVKRNNHTDQ